VALINHRTREIHFKIVYYGCGLCGKTTNLRSLHDRLPPERRGKMISIATDNERTLFFDFLPIDLGQVNGFLTRFHLYTVPGQVYYKLSRRAVLQGVDGLVFVADSHPAREHANRESLADLHDHLRTLGISGPVLARIPWVLQYNKRDVAMPVPLERLRAALNPHGWPDFEAVASDGRGVNETLRAACKAVLARLAAGTPVPSHAPDAAAARAVGAPHAAVPAHAAPEPAAPRPLAPEGAPFAARPAVIVPARAVPAAPPPAWPAPAPPRITQPRPPLQAQRPAAAPPRIAQARPPLVARPGGPVGPSFAPPIRPALPPTPLRPGGPLRSPFSTAPPPPAPRPPAGDRQPPQKPRST
jgi:signal recognition particle receptor subunit beta